MSWKVVPVPSTTQANEAAVDVTNHPVNSHGLPDTGYYPFEGAVEMTCGQIKKDGTTCVNVLRSGSEKKIGACLGHIRYMKVVPDGTG